MALTCHLCHSLPLVTALRLRTKLAKAAKVINKFIICAYKNTTFSMDVPFLNPPNAPMTSIFTPATEPVMLKDSMFLDSISESLLVGSANVTSTYWEGALQTFSDFKQYESASFASFYNGPIIFDGKHIGKNKILIAESESCLKLLCNDAESKQLIPTFCVDHCEPIKQIALWNNEQKVLTASDNYITQWDINTNIQLLWNFGDYHTNDISYIDTQKDDNNVFVSAGRDHRVCLWDTRMEEVACELYYNEFCAVTSAACNQENSNMIVAGTQAGHLYMLDLRNVHEIVNIQPCYKKAVSKLKFNGTQLAVVGDTNEIQVYNCKGNEFNLRYKDCTKHYRFIRDALWYQDELYTCGLESALVKHSF